VAAAGSEAAATPQGAAAARQLAPKSLENRRLAEAPVTEEPEGVVRAGVQDGTGEHPCVVAMAEQVDAVEVGGSIGLEGSLVRHTGNDPRCRIRGEGQS
jgi:hypothetical protein